MDICTGRITTNDNAQPQQNEALLLAFYEVAERGGHIRVIGEITKDYVDYWKQFGKKVELRHLSGVSAYFGVSDFEYLAIPGSEAFNPNGPLLYSNEESFVKHHHLLFDMLWDNAVPSEAKIREIETGELPSRTEVVRGADKVTETLFQAVQRAKSTIGILAQSAGPKLLFEINSYQKLFLESKSRGVKIRYITEITGDNIEYCKQMIDLFSAEVRHAESPIGNFLVTDAELVATASSISGGQPIPEVIYSNVMELVQRNVYFFNNVWERAIPAEIRFAELENGERVGETKLTFDTREIFDSANKFVDEMKEEALVILTEQNSITRNPTFFEKIVAKAKTEGTKVKILGRFSSEEIKLMDEYRSSGVQMRTLGSTSRISNLSLGIYDRKWMGLVQYLYPSLRKRTPSTEPYLSGIISTDSRMIDGIAAIFESLWGETDLRQRAELLQDILSHDIRNYCQVTKFNGELLLDQIGADPYCRKTLEDLQRSIDNTVKMVEKAQQLSKVLSEGDVTLYAVDLMKTIEDSLNLIKDAYRDEKMIVDERKVRFELTSNHNEAFVLADELLGSIFENLYSNCARYTDSNRVLVETLVEEGDAEHWKVSISDHGRGIKDVLKDQIFMRYLESDKGSGLGMSIVHSLAVERYKGRVQIKDRVPGDYTKGTLVEIWLRKGVPAPPATE